MTKIQITAPGGFRVLGVLLFAAVGFVRAQPASGQIAPASIANTVIYFHSIASSTISDSVILFRSDGTYAPLIYTSRTSSLPVEHAVPGSGGTYTYSVTGLTTAQLVTKDNEAPIQTTPLVFSTSENGSYANGQSVALEVRPVNSGESMVATSLRSRVGGGAVSIGGVALSGPRTRRALIRAVGPGLARFGLTNFLSDPFLEIYDSAGRKLDSAGTWGVGPVPQESFRRLMNLVGMYPLPDDSKDAVLFSTLPPGTYTIQCSSASGASSGEAVIECYLLP